MRENIGNLLRHLYYVTLVLEIADVSFNSLEIFDMNKSTFNA